ncbi:bet1-like protein At4g14600 isoform X2 [Physcomitrium patens]|uniref:t-SNARE coiled-coil homology domain-containing protein n=1 Tax=Physcomitrium patens TaxID=3218 RepID=A0A2K1KGL1_PHYPA|nr:bet1-like protein At4g14600 isoform X2 [Physcomitrium patens]PNR52899.1 hypothetical protein PHYPA_009274 [Physcomitrium patens]|eukprot:XP_024377302.1 bet1-like protein At4g14600 isoform X2 [Physcomitrella patens]
MAWIDDSLGRRKNPGNRYNSNQVQLRVDPRDQLDEKISGLSGKVAQLKQVAQHIETETRFQSDILNQLISSYLKNM